MGTSWENIIYGNLRPKKNENTKRNLNPHIFEFSFCIYLLDLFVLPWRAPTPQVTANRLRRAASDSALVRRVEEIGARLSPSLSKPPASERLAALALRVKAKLEPSATCSA